MANPDLQALLDSLLVFAQSMLAEHGSFHAFGAMMWLDGSIQWVGADSGEEFPDGQTLINMMTEIFREQAALRAIRAATICYDSLTIPPGETTKVDAICFALEHRLGDSMSFFIPYVRDTSGVVEYSELFAVKRTAQFFPLTVQ